MKAERYQQIEQLFHAALERKPEERATFLEQACGEDEALRREVESLLPYDEQARSFIGTPPANVAAAILAAELDQSMVGRTLGHYCILSRLGAGGMGEVYLAEDTKLGRKVAIKLLPPETADDEQSKKRLLREAQAAATLDHSNVCAIYEVGEQDGHGFIVMQYLEGETLSNRIKNKPLELKEALDVAVQVADALAEAHSRGVTHRDIKPQNIMISAKKQVKVLDFGLAKLIQDRQISISEATAESLITGPGMLVGTVPYMSPEQLRGEVVDARSDLFSLGVVLYEMIAGSPPFAGATVADLLVSILDKAPLPLASHVAEAPAALDHLINRCLAKQRQQRYPSARELLTDLRSLAAQLSQPQPAAKPSPSIAVLAFINMSADPENEYFCDGLAAELLNALAKIKALRVAARTSAFFFKGKNTDAREIGQNLNVGAVLEGSVRKVGNRLRITAQLINVADGYHLWSERYDREMEDIFDLQDEISLAIVDALKVELMGVEKAAVVKRYTDNAEAYQLYLKGRYFWYRFPAPGYEKSREYFQQSIDADPTYALGYCGLADYFGMAAAEGLTPPDEGWPKCEAAMNKALVLDDTLAEIYNSKAGISFIYYRDWPAAERAFKHAMELNPNFAEVRNHYALCLASYGRTEEAVTESRRALRLDSLSLHRNLWLARVFFWSGRYDEAIEQCYRTLDLDGNSPLAYEWLGDAYEQKGQHAEAIAAWSRAIVLRGKGELAALVDHTFAASGFDAAVRALALQRLKRLNEKKERGAYVPAMAFVTLYLRLGDCEQTTAWLAKAVLERNRAVLGISIDPRYESLRSAPQYAGLARQMGFTQ
jgi:eukaryotic-like serine/threonine-protein kinase